MALALVAQWVRISECTIIAQNNQRELFLAATKNFFAALPYPYDRRLMPSKHFVFGVIIMPNLRQWCIWWYRIGIV